MTPRVKPIIIVQGAQWGSEAKGMVAAALSLQRKVQLAVRTGSVNAGHTVYWEGYPQKMQQLPTAWVNPQTKLVIGAGAFIHPEILANEIANICTLTGEDIRARLFIDRRVSLHLPEHTEQATLEQRHLGIGATGKGCSVALCDKIRYRGKGYRLFHEWLCDQSQPSEMRVRNRLDGIKFVDTVEMLHEAYDAGAQILLEGTQGTFLDLHLGPYPYTTHKQTTAAQWVTEAGLAPGMEYETCLVARSFPIRVAGNSGPMPGETTWPNVARTINKALLRHRLGQKVESWALVEWETAQTELAQGKWKDRLPKYLDGSPNWDMHKWDRDARIKYKEALSELNRDTWWAVSEKAQVELGRLFEFTTVTNKLRRVAMWDPRMVTEAVKINRASYVALTFFNYWCPETWGWEQKNWAEEYPGVVHAEIVRQKQEEIGAPIRYISTGPLIGNLIRVL